MAYVCYCYVFVLAAHVYALISVVLGGHQSRKLGKWLGRANGKKTATVTENRVTTCMENLEMPGF